MNSKTGIAIITTLWLMLQAATAYAAEPDFFTRFFTDLHTLQADFDQQVVDGNKQVLQSSSGHMWIARPGRFRWNYETPYRQQLVADGQRLWSFDEDLEQVTVQPAGDVITSTPAMLLSGDQPVDTLFHIEAATEGQSVILIPKSDDSNILKLQVYFSDNSLTRIDAEDSFGNTTQFSFSNMQRNPTLKDKLFTFTPPAGADVIGNTD